MTIELSGEPPPPAVIVHGLAHARAALAPGRPVLLLSAPGAASYAGCAWWRALVATALSGHPGRHEPDMLDCADAPGRALEALQAGCKLLMLHPGPAWADIAGRASALGAALLPSAPASLDLGQHGAERRLAAWLAHRPAVPAATASPARTAPGPA